jgi:mRNA-degrading endonuclease RelE of RelBE toxin-antitoxin system
MDIIFSPQAEKFLRKCDPNIRRRILKKMILYSSAMEPLDFAEHLTDDAEAPYRYRIGKDWRVKFDIENKKIVIKRIGRRDDIYN